jgi:hypothetical protein
MKAQRVRWRWMVNATPGHFTSGKRNGYLLYRRLDGPQDQSGEVRNISPLEEFDPWTV